MLSYVTAISPKKLHHISSFAGRTSTSKVVVRGTAPSSRVYQATLGFFQFLEFLKAALLSFWPLQKASWPQPILWTCQTMSADVSRCQRFCCIFRLADALRQVLAPAEEGCVIAFCWERESEDQRQVHPCMFVRNSCDFNIQSRYSLYSLSSWVSFEQACAELMYST